MLAPAKHVSAAPARQPPGHIPALDGVRGLAAATVFIYHYGGGARSAYLPLHVIGEIIHLGWAGVSLFFVLSGFLITGILLESMKRPRWGETFYVRRTLRIFPLYYCALLGAVFVNLFFRTPRSSISAVWPFFVYLQDIPGLVRIEVLGPLFSIGHFWSLAVEEQFYLVWPVLLLLASKRGQVKQLCLGTFLCSLMFRVCIFGFHLNSEWAAYFIAGRAGELAAGGFLAASLRGSERERCNLIGASRLLLIASAAGVMLIVLWTRELGPRDSWMGTLGITFFSLLFTALIAQSLQPGVMQRILSFKILRWLGKISYGIYVYHLLLYPFFAWLAHELFPNLTGDGYLLVLAAIAMVGTLVVAAISFATLETGFLRLKDSLGKPYPILADGVLSPKP